jgi:hypothetical protein
VSFIVEASLDRNVGKKPAARIRNDQTLSMAQSAFDQIPPVAKTPFGSASAKR